MRFLMQMLIKSQLCLRVLLQDSKSKKGIEKNRSNLKSFKLKILAKNVKILVALI